MKNKLLVILFSFAAIMALLISCSDKSVAPAEIEDGVPIAIESSPTAASISYRIESRAEGIPNTNYTHLGRTPYFGTASIQELVPRINEDNKDQVTIVLRISKEPNYYPIIERFKADSVLTSRGIKKMYELTKRDKD